MIFSNDSLALHVGLNMFKFIAYPCYGGAYGKII